MAKHLLDKSLLVTDMGDHLLFQQVFQEEVEGGVRTSFGNPSRLEGKIGPAALKDFQTLIFQQKKKLVEEDRKGRNEAPGKAGESEIPVPKEKEPKARKARG